MKTIDQRVREDEKEKAPNTHKKDDKIIRLVFWWVCLIVVLLFELMVQ